jgi:hypothetical protein
MATAWTDQQRNAEAAALAFDERVGLLVDAEWLCRENERLVSASVAVRSSVEALPRGLVMCVIKCGKYGLNKPIARSVTTTGACGQRPSWSTTSTS